VVDKHCISTRIALLCLCNKCIILGTVTVRLGFLRGLKLCLIFTIFISNDNELFTRNMRDNVCSNRPLDIKILRPVLETLNP
jgi:hypothetical protein